MDKRSNAKVLACAACDSPVLAEATACRACGKALSGKEYPYILQREAGPDIPGLVKWWGIWSLVIWALSGFSLGVTTSLLFAGVSFVYLMRILRACYP
jgi:hypothetical protein